MVVFAVVNAKIAVTMAELAVVAAFMVGVVTIVSFGFPNVTDLTLVNENCGIVSIVWIGLEAVVVTFERQEMVAVNFMKGQ